MNILNILQIITTFFVGITAFLIFLQYRLSKKPEFRIEVKQGNKENKVQNVLEHKHNSKNILGGDDLYMFVSNISKNTARKISVSYSFVDKKYKNKISDSYKILYLHPSEMWKTPLPF